MLSNTQKTFIDVVRAGHSVLLTGQAGSGKTYIVNLIANELHVQQGKNVSVTCTTGIAATQYENGQTVHKWCGLGDGSIQKQELSKLILSDERYHDVKNRIKTCDCLFIDECSMLSKKNFDAIEYICREVRGGCKYFGGLQIILIGDFYQLPPVEDELYGESGQYCFESRNFHSSIPHHVNLDVVFRQCDAEFINCINEISKGSPSQSAVDFIKRLERPIVQTETTTHLFAKNFSVCIFNHDRLVNFPGNMKVYNAIEEGDAFYLRKIQAPKKLGLKVGCPVMLLVNLSDVLVNGLRGTVLKMGDENITVHFEKNNTIIDISKHVFTKTDPVSRRTLAKRVQFPLSLSFAITIHKSQGMTLDSAIVDCEDARIPGQIGVALGRVTSADNIQVKNFNSSLAIEHSKQVKTIYQHSSAPFLNSGLCCRADYLSLETEKELQLDFEPGLDIIPETTFRAASSDETESASDIDISNFSENESGNSCSLYSLQHFFPEPLPSDIDPMQLLQNTCEEFSGTPLELSINTIRSKLQENTEPLITWIGVQFLALQKRCENWLKDISVLENKHATRFCTDINLYMKSEEYINSCNALLKKYNTSLNKEFHMICTSICFGIQRSLLENKTEQIQSQPQFERPLPTENFDEGKGNTRYIGGYCIAKIKFKYQKQVQNCLYDSSKISTLHEGRKKLSLIGQVTTSQTEIMSNSDFPATLLSTSRKQNQRQSLTNITDEAYLFFESLKNKIRSLETFENLHHQGENLIEMINTTVKSDSDLLHQWISLFKIPKSPDKVSSVLSDSVDISAFGLELYYEIVSKFTKVSCSYFRKEYLRFVKKEKGKAHRKRVMEKKIKENTKRLPLDEVKSDRSLGKVVSHLKLKAAVLTDENYFNDKFYTKKDLNQLCEAYSIPVTVKNTKKELNDLLVGVIKQCDSLLTPQALDTECGQPNPESLTLDTTSKATGRKTTKRKKTGSSKVSKKNKTTDAHLDCCKICKGPFDDSPDWIQCDTCDCWVHGSCVGILTKEDWVRFEDDSVNFFCPHCLSN